MPLTHDSIATIFAPLVTDNQAPFFQHLSPEIVWKYTGSHPLAGKYEGLPAVAAGTFAKLHGCFAAPLKVTVESVVVDSTTNTAAIELRSVGSSKSGLGVDTLAVWICKANTDNIFVEITSYVDSAFLVKLLEESK